MKTRVLFKSTAVLMTALLMCACVKEEMADYNPEQPLYERVTVIAGIGEDADTKITLGEDLGSTTEVLWSPEDSIALTDGQKLYVFNRSDDSDVATERAEFTYNGKAGSLPATGTKGLKFVYPVSAPEKYSQQPGSIDGVSDFMQMEALIPESTTSLEGLQLTFSHSTAVIKLELTSDAFFNQEASVIFSYSNRSTYEECEIRTEKLKADAQGVVTAYIVHPAASLKNIRIYVKTSSGLHETSLSSKQIMPGKLYKVKKNDFAQSNELLEGMLPEGEVFCDEIEDIPLEIQSEVIRYCAVNQLEPPVVQREYFGLVFLSGCSKHYHSSNERINIGHNQQGTIFFEYSKDLGYGNLVIEGESVGGYIGGVVAKLCTSADEFEFHPNSSKMFLDSGFEHIFFDCKVNTSNVTDMSYMFSGCSSIQGLSGFDTSNVTDMSGMFSGSSNIPDLSGFDTSNVTDMSHMFSGCHSIPDLSGFDTSNVTDMSYMFSGCRSLTSLDLSSFDTSSVTDMSYMFSGWEDLTSLDLSSFDFSKVESFSGMLEESEYGTSNRPIPIIVTQEGYDILKDKDTGLHPDYAYFSFAGKLSGDAFNDSVSSFLSKNTSVTRMKFIAGSQDSGTPIGDSDASMIINGDCLEIHTSAQEFVFCDDCSGMFSNLDRVTEIDFNHCVNTSSVTDMSDMFYNCYSLTSLDLSCFNTSNVTDMSGMFYDCRYIESLDLSNFDFSKVTLFDKMLSATGFRAPFNPIFIIVTQEGYDILKDKDTGINSSYAYLCPPNPSAGSLTPGIIFNNSLHQFLSQHSSITRMKFIAGSQVAGTSILGSDAVMVANGNCLEIHTSAPEFVFDEDCFRMFYNLDFVTEIDFNDCINTSNVAMMNGMFYDCHSLTSLDLSCFNTSNVTSMSYMFYGCDALTSLDLSSFNTSKVTYMTGMFEYCHSLTSLDLSSFNTSNVTSMSYMFYGCDALTSLDLSSFNTSNVTSMSYMFNYCADLTSLDLSGFDTSNVTDMSYMFYGCSSIPDLSSFDTSNVTNMSYMFSGSSYIKLLDLSSFDFSKVELFSGMFEDRQSISWLLPIIVTQEGYDILKDKDTGIHFNAYFYVPNPKAGSLAKGDIFNIILHQFLSQHSSITRMKFIAGSQVAGTSILGSDAVMVANGNCLEIHTSAPEFVFDEDCFRMFWDLDSVTEIDFNDCINTSNVAMMNGMFSDCDALASLDLSSFDTSNLTNMNGMFEHSGKLAALDLSSFDTSNVTSMRGVFYSCRSLTSLDLSSFNTSNVTDMSYMFSGCSSIPDLSSFNTSKVTYMTGMFEYCHSLTSLDLSSFNTSNVTDMSGMFEYCRNLTSLDLSSFDFNKVKSFGSMFWFLGSMASNKPISISVTQAGYDILNAQSTGINYSYAKLVVVP